MDPIHQTLTVLVDIVNQCDGSWKKEPNDVRLIMDMYLCSGWIGIPAGFVNA